MACIVFIRALSVSAASYLYFVQKTREAAEVVLVGVSSSSHVNYSLGEEHPSRCEFSKGLAQVFHCLL